MGFSIPQPCLSDRLLKISHTFAITTHSSNRLLVARLDSKGIEYLQDCVAAGKKIDVKKLKVEKSTKLEDQDTQGLISEPWHVIGVLENSLATQVSTMKNEAH